MAKEPERPKERRSLLGPPPLCNMPQYVFAIFAASLLVGAVITAFCAIETKGRVLEELSP